MAINRKKTGGGVRLSGHLICVSEHEVEIVRRHLCEHVRLTRAESGCLWFDVSPTDDPLIWTVHEYFQNREAFEAHQKRTRASVWGAATAEISRDFKVTGLD